MTSKTSKMSRTFLIPDLVRSYGLKVLRSLKNICAPPERNSKNQQLSTLFVILNEVKNLSVSKTIDRTQNLEIFR